MRAIIKTSQCPAVPHVAPFAKHKTNKSRSSTEKTKARAARTHAMLQSHTGVRIMMALPNMQKFSN